MNLTIKEVLSKSELKKFVGFQYDLYKNNKFWIPPLRFDELNSLRSNINPAFDFCEAKYWLVYEDKKIVGRVAGIINKKHNEKWNKKDARFGWIDFVNDTEVSSLLLKTVEEWAKTKGMNRLHGPLGFTDMDGEGTLIEGFDEESTLGNIYNYPYYPKHIEQNGYNKDIDWIEYNVKIPEKTPEKIERIAEISLKRNNLHLPNLKKAKDLKPFAKEIFHLINDTYKELFGFTELTDRQIDFYVKQYFSFIRPEYVPIVLDENNKVAAFGITMPSLNYALQNINGRIFPFGFIFILREMKKSHKLDLYLTAVRDDLQNKGVNALLINQINKVCIKNGIRSVETNRELESNEKIRAQWKLYDARQHKRRRCYIKILK
jgi:GNAT superfamily N-acetyltransferase